MNKNMRERAGAILSPYRRHLDDMAAFGAGFLHLRLTPHVREKLKARTGSLDELIADAKKVFADGFTENPLMVECPALETVYFEPDLSIVCEVGERTVSQVIAAF